MGLFHGLPGVWQEGDFYDIVWQQIHRQLKTGGDLNKSERLVLLELLDRVAAAKRATRKALGISVRKPTATRNEKIADLYIRLREFEGLPRRDAEAQVYKAFPKVGDGAVRKIIDSNHWLAPARGRQLAAYLIKNKITGPIVIKVPSK